MSYDLYIRSDDKRTRVHSCSYVREIVKATLHLPEVSERQAIMEDEARNQYMEIDFALCNDDGDSILGDDGAPEDTCNQLELHVPYAHIAGNGTDDRAYFDIAHALAAALGWQVYDAQLDRYLDPNAPHPKPRSI